MVLREKGEVGVVTAIKRKKRKLVQLKIPYKGRRVEDVCSSSSTGRKSRRGEGT